MPGIIKRHIVANLAYSNESTDRGPQSHDGRADIRHPTTRLNSIRHRKPKLTELAQAQLHEPKELLPGSEYIGCGYDVFGHYASAQSVMAPMIEPTLFKPFGDLYIPDFVTVTPLNRTHMYRFQAESQPEYHRKLAVQAGLSGAYAFFKGAFKSAFLSEASHSSVHRFAEHIERIHLWSVRLKNPNLRALLRDDVRELIDHGTPELLFRLYGGYMLTGANIGGECRLIAYTNLSELSTNLDISVALGLEFAKVATGDFTAEAEKQVSELEQSSRIELVTRGGDPLLGGTAITDPASYNAWRESVGSRTASANEAVAIDFATPGLYEVWRLASDRDRQMQLRESWESYAEKQSISAPPPQTTARYQITTRTSGKMYAGTDAIIRAQLVGRLGNSKTITLAGAFERKDIDTTQVTLLELGDIHSIILTNDGSGDSPGWRVDRVTIESIDSGKTWERGAMNREIEAGESSSVTLLRTS